MNCAATTVEGWTIVAMGVDSEVRRTFATAGSYKLCLRQVGTPDSVEQNGINMSVVES